MPINPTTTTNRLCQNQVSTETIISIKFWSTLQGKTVLHFLSRKGKTLLDCRLLGADIYHQSSDFAKKSVAEIEPSSPLSSIKLDFSSLSFSNKS